MTKKLLSAVITVSMLLSFAVMPAHAATYYNTSTFSSDNWAQYERGFYTSTSNFTENMKVYKDTSYDDAQLTSVRMVASTSSKITSTKNPVAYKYGDGATSYGEHQDDKATYAHMRFYLATFDDVNHNIFDDFYLRIDKDGTGSSRATFTFDNIKDNTNGHDSEIYADSYTSSAAYITKDWKGILKKQGYNGNGPNASTAAADCDARTRILADSDYDKIDIIAEFNKQNGCTTYIFANGKFMANYYDSGLTDKHFHGIVIRTPANKTPRNNSSYVAVKFDDDRIGHREYYDTDDYKVTFEDVLQDAGLGSGNDPKVIYQTYDIQSYMPGNDQVAYTYKKDATERTRFNENVTYSENTATITATYTSTEKDDFETAANMLAGMYPLIGKMGVGYENYHPRAKYIKVSFDQKLSNSGIWVEYSTYYSGKAPAFTMWNTDGYLSISVKGGGGSVTCNGKGSKPTAQTTGTNHFDWILEPNDTGGDDSNMKQTLYVNNVKVKEGSFGTQYAVRVNDILIGTNHAAGEIEISNWSMTLYNSLFDMGDIENELLYSQGYLLRWADGGFEQGEGDNSDKFVIYGKATSTNQDDLPLADTKIYTALYDESGNFIYLNIADYVENRTIGSETEENLFNTSYGGVVPATAKMMIWNPTNRKAYAVAKEIELSFN